MERERLEEISEKYTYEYLLAVLNSRFSNLYLNAIRRHKLPNTFYPDDFRKVPIKELKNQTLYVNLVSILQFIYQSGELENYTKLYDQEVLNFLIYEIYFKRKLKEQNKFQDLHTYLNGELPQIEFKRWIQLKFKTDISEKDHKELEKVENQIINQIEKSYNKLNNEELKDKLDKMKELEWISELENKF
ncbi:MAG: hypothetical protein GF311_06380 [Candidatus Lokiarchaeota archaeon]|nr:hypothetical protein [Candidatus Lokiarchaeota archaeon]